MRSGIRIDLITRALRAYRGARRDLATVVEWWKRAAAKGHPNAIVLLGSSYNLGDGVAKNPRLALQYFLKGAELGENVVFFWIGNAYEEGAGTARDAGKMLYWYERAVRERGASNDVAALRLGEYYGRIGRPAIKERFMLKRIRKKRCTGLSKLFCVSCLTTAS